MAGAEIAQLYVACPNGKVFRPKRELKGFQKVFLQPGEEREVTIPLDDKAFRYFNVRSNAWRTESRTYELQVCASASDLRLRAELQIAQEPSPHPYPRMPHYRSGDVRRVPDAEFEALLGRPIPDGSWGAELGENDTLGQMSRAKSPLARLACRILNRRKKKAEAAGRPDLNILFLLNMPFRAIAKMSGGAFSRAMVADLLLIVNGRFWRGLGRLIRDYFRNRKAEKAFRKHLEEDPTTSKPQTETEACG